MPLEDGETFLDPGAVAYARSGHGGEKSTGKKPHWKAIKNVLKKAQKQTHRRYVAIYSVRKKHKRRYKYTVSPLRFSPQARQGGKGQPVQPFLYMLNEDSLGTPRMAVALIPAGKQARKEMLAWILPRTPDAAGPMLARSSLVQSTADGCEWVEIRPGGEVLIPVNGNNTWIQTDPAVYRLECSPHDPRYDDPTMYDNMYNWPESGRGGPSNPSHNGSDGSDDDQDSPPVCDPNSPINPVGCVKPESESVRFLGQIDASDLTNHPKANCIYQKLDQTNTMKNIISKFAGEDTYFDLDITAEPLTDAPDGNPRPAIVRPNMDSSLPITIVINSRYIDRLPDLLLATTFLHEAIHAEMIRKVRSIGGYPGLNQSNFPGLYDFWTRFGSNYQHEEMAAFYLNILIGGISEYDNGQHTRSFYKSLALSELKSTVTWDNLSDGEQDKVDDDVNNLIMNGNYSCN